MRLHGGTGVDSDDGFGPFLEFGHFLSGKLIPVAGDVDGTIIINHKFGVLKSPPVDFKPLFLIPDGFRSFYLFFTQHHSQIL